MSSFNEILTFLSEKTASSAAFGKKIKFLLDNNIIHIDGTTTPPTVTTNDEKADATVVASADMFAKLMTKQVNPQMAFMTGKIKLQGDMGAALALQKIFG